MKIKEDFERPIPLESVAAKWRKVRHLYELKIEIN